MTDGEANSLNAHIAACIERHKSLERRLDSMNADVRDISHKIYEISSTLDQARGGWRMALLLAGLVGGAVSFLVKFAIK